MCKVVTNGYNAGATLLANTFIDKFMCDASELNLKVYLYLLRHSHDEISLSAIAGALDFTKNSVLKALKYWQGISLIDYAVNAEGELTELVIHDANLIASMSTSSTSKDIVRDTEDVEKDNASKKEAKKEEVKEAHAVSEAVVNILNDGKIPNWPNIDGGCDCFENDEFNEKLLSMNADDIDSLSFIIKHPLSPVEIDLISFLYNKKAGCGFDCDLIVYLFKICISNINKQYNEASQYYNKVALDWYEKGYKTIADMLIPEIESHLGVQFNTPANRKKAVEWVTKKKLNVDVIIYACDRVAETKDTDRIKCLTGKINNYVKDKVTTLDDVIAREKRFAERSDVAYIKNTASNSFNNFDQRSISKEEDIALEKALINKNITQEKLDSFKSRLKAAGNAAKKKPANW